MNGHVITIELLPFGANIYRVTVVDLDHGNKPEGMEDVRSFNSAYKLALRWKDVLGYPVRLKQGHNLRAI